MRVAYRHARSHPTAATIMRKSRSLVTLTPEMPIAEAIRLLLKHKISGAPVVDEHGKLIGICSELDCLRVLAAGEFYADDHREEGTVGDYMSHDFKTVGPDEDIYSLAHYFLTHSVRRLPVLENGELIGQLSRRDVLRGMEDMGAGRAAPRRYPDYREPSSDVGARRH
jgi:CBS domain-containing protein